MNILFSLQREHLAYRSSSTFGVGRLLSNVCTETNFQQIAGICTGESQLRLGGGTAVSPQGGIILLSEPYMQMRTVELGLRQYAASIFFTSNRSGLIQPRNSERCLKFPIAFLATRIAHFFFVRVKPTRNRQISMS
jgi:hypothetical protein